MKVCVTPRDRLQASSYNANSPGLRRRQPAGDEGWDCVGASLLAMKVCVTPRDRLQASSYNANSPSLLAMKAGTV
jgi:hypothetical protein